MFNHANAITAEASLVVGGACTPQVQKISEAKRHNLIPMALASARFQPDLVIDYLNLGEAEDFTSGSVSGAGKGMGMMFGVVGSKSGSATYCAAGSISCRRRHAE